MITHLKLQYINKYWDCTTYCDIYISVLDQTIRSYFSSSTSENKQHQEQLTCSDRYSAGYHAATNHSQTRAQEVAKQTPKDHSIHILESTTRVTTLSCTENQGSQNGLTNWLNVTQEKKKMKEAKEERNWTYCCSALQKISNCNTSLHSTNH